MNFNGKISRNHENMRVEFAQMCALEADHSFIYNIDNITDNYDNVILLIPKTEAETVICNMINYVVTFYKSF